MPPAPVVYSNGAMIAPPIAMGVPPAAMPMATGKVPAVHSRRHHFKPQDDERLIMIMANHSQPLKLGEWTHIAEEMGNQFSAQQCQDRWANYLRPPLDRSPLTVEEKRLLVKYWIPNPKEWKKIATKSQHYKIRSPAFVKSYLNAQIRKMAQLGVKPLTPEEVDLLPDSLFMPGMPDVQEMDDVREQLYIRRRALKQSQDEPNHEEK